MGVSDWPRGLPIDVATSDAIFAVVNGVPPDEGVMIELGMAIALKKPTFLFRDDLRRVVESEQYPLNLNLMLFTGLPEDELAGLLLHVAGGDSLAPKGAGTMGQTPLAEPLHKSLPP